MNINPFDPRENYTRVHNYVLDKMMPTLKPNEWKVLCFILRKTTGWGKDAERLSYTEMMAGTGIGSRSTLSAALDGLVERGYILCQVDPDQFTANTYQLNTTFSVPSTEIVPSTETVPAPSTETVLYIRNKEKNKESDKDISSFAGAKATTRTRKKEPHPNTKAILDSFVEVVPYKINYAREGAAAKTLAEQGYTPEQVVTVYRKLKAESFWSEKHLSLQSVASQIGAMLTNSVTDLSSPNHPAWQKNKVEMSDEQLQQFYDNLPF